MSDRNQPLDPQPDKLKKIKHIVVLMLENRSFDNLLGWLYEGETPPRGQDFEGLNENLWNPLDNFDSDGNPFTEKVGVRKNGAEFYINGKKQDAPGDNFTLPTPDPGEGFRDTTHQLYGAYKVDEVFPPTPLAIGFVNNYKNAMLNGTYSFGDAPTDPREIMNCYSPDQTPVLSMLAKKFAVCDKYSCSIPSQTLPNRDFVHAATSTGYVNNDPNNQCDARTIYNQIQDAIEAGRDDLSWGIYSGYSKDKASKKWEPFSLTRLTMVQVQGKEFDANFKVMGDFYKDAHAGTLPSYSFLEPQFSGTMQNDQHPPTDIRSGEKLIADVYEAVRKSKKWKETLLVITYDEHGGCYDHAPPTESANPPEGQKDGAEFPTGQLGFMFKRFGVRVPTVVVSPYIEKGTIGRPSGWTPFDHTSIIKTVQNCFGLHEHLTHRDENAPDLSCLLTRDRARRDKPRVKPLAYQPESGDHVNDLHRQCASIMSKKLGDRMPEDHEVHAYNYSAYKKCFDRKRK